MNWEYNEKLSTWVCGTMNNGCGVYSEGNDWYANVVTPLNLSIIGPFTSLEEAKNMAEVEFFEFGGQNE